MDEEDPQERVAHMTVRELIRRCPPGPAMKDALERRSRRKRRATDGDDRSQLNSGSRRTGDTTVAQEALIEHESAIGRREGPAVDDHDTDPKEVGKTEDDTVFAPQVRLEGDQIVIDPTSLTVTAGHADGKQDPPAVVIEQNSKVTYGTYMKGNLREVAEGGDRPLL